jgi:hypothetical protein
MTMATKTPKAKKGTGTDLAVVPPGEHDAEIITVGLPGETMVDETLVAEAAQEVNRIHAAKGLEAYRASGEYLLATFFGGDLAAFGKKGKKHASFRALAKRDDIAVKHTGLWYSVALLAQLRQLPQDIGTALPMSHHRLLIPVKDEKAKLDLAREAVEGKLAKREFEARVRAVRKQKSPTATGAGRPALPPWARGIGSIERAVEAAVCETIPDSEVIRHGTAAVEKRLAEVTAAVVMLENFKATLTEALTVASRAEELADDILSGD